MIFVQQVMHVFIIIRLFYDCFSGSNERTCSRKVVQSSIISESMVSIFSSDARTCSILPPRPFAYHTTFPAVSVKRGPSFIKLITFLIPGMIFLMAWHSSHISSVLVLFVLQSLHRCSRTGLLSRLIFRVSCVDMCDFFFFNLTINVSYVQKINTQ